jgi:F-type H+-transporting ATPase subunit delta
MELKISRRYAQALFELARDGDVLDATGKQLADLAEIFRSHPAVSDFLANAVAEEAQQRQFLDALMQRVGSDELLRRFVGLLLSKGRAVLLPLIEGHYQDLAEEHLGQLAAEVETARPLGAEVRERLERALSQYTGKTVRLSERVRPELIAGIRIQIGSFLIDGTLERQLSALNRAMLS